VTAAATHDDHQDGKDAHIQLQGHLPGRHARVGHTGQPVLVTRRGQPVAQVVPPPPAPIHGWLGCLRGTGRIARDVVSPALDEDRWEALAR